MRLILILLLLFGGGGYYMGPVVGYYGGSGVSLLVIIVLFLLFGRGRRRLWSSLCHVWDKHTAEFNLKSEKGTRPRSGRGIRLIRDFRRSEMTIPILVYTVMEGDLYKTTSFDAGADDFILKQIPLSDFSSCLGDLTVKREE